MTLAVLLADTLARWGAMMRRPLHPTAPPPPIPDLMIDEEVYRDAVRAKWETGEDAEPALLPSTDYRTNPRPVQTPVMPREPTLDALRAGLLARGLRADALRAAVARAIVKDI